MDNLPDPMHTDSIYISAPLIGPSKPVTKLTPEWVQVSRSRPEREVVSLMCLETSV